MQSMDYFPVFLALKDRQALIVGGNGLAARKAALIAKSGAHITVLANCFSEQMQALAAEHTRITLSQATFQKRSLDGVALVLAATDDDSLNQEVFAEASHRGIPVNIADQPELCSYILPAIVDRSPVIVAVSTGGRSPVLARYVKALLERALPQTLGQFAQLLKRWRLPVKHAISSEKARRRFWETTINGKVAELAGTGKLAEAEQEIQLQLADPSHSDDHGSLALIGTPELDPEMLSIKAHRLIYAAEWVFYDNDTPAAVLELARREANVCNVDNSASGASAKLMAKQLSCGQRVVRLFGRDPSLTQEATANRLQFANQNIEFSLLPASDAILDSRKPKSQAHPSVQI